MDKERVQLFTVKPPVREPGAADTDQPSHAKVDQHLKVRVPVTAGPHVIGVAFPKKPSVLLETPRQPYQTHFNSYRHPRIQPAIYSVSIVGPYAAKGPGDTPSRRRIFGSQPSRRAQGGPPTLVMEARSARQILSSLMRRAYRRPVTDADLKGPLGLYDKARADGDFEAGIEMALSAVLVSPEFLFRVERDPAGIAPNTAYRISDLELASRLSFFLWSSIPDDELLDAAVRRTSCTSPPCSIDRSGGCWRTRRSKALVTNFAAQWLHLRNLDSITPDMRLFPDFDDNLRQAFRRETELFFESVLREDRSVLDLLQRQLHVPQRAAREALRHSARVWQPLPAGDARRGQLARRTAASGKHSDRDVVCDADVAGDSRQMDPRKPSGRPPRRRRCPTCRR